MSAQADEHQNQIFAKALVKKYHTNPVLNRLSISIKRGAFCVLVGDNGAGKTTLLRILAGFVRPDAGEIRLSGDTLHGHPQNRQKIGYVGHQTMLYQDLNAVENLLHYAHLYRLNPAETRAAEAIDSVGLGKYKHQMLRTYSRGMQQRLSIARALLHDPEILLLDEPYTGLDKSAARFLDERLDNLHQQGKTIFLAAHNPQRILSIATHVAWLKDGVIAEHIPVSAQEAAADLNAYLQEAA